MKSESSSCHLVGEVHEIVKIGIVGAGAMGSLLGFYLSEHAEVWLLDLWQAHVEAINTNGLCRELGGTSETRYPRATTDPSAIGPCDAVLVLVKAQQTVWAAEQARSLLRTENQEPKTTRNPVFDSQFSAEPAGSRSRTLVVTLQNGIGNRELLAQML